MNVLDAITLDDRLDVVQRGTVAFACAALGMFYISSQFSNVRDWVSDLQGSNPWQVRRTHAESTAIPSNSTRRVTSVVVRAGELVDSVTFKYSDMPSGVTFGGNGGTEFPPFELEANEFILEVRGRRGAYLDQIQFVTNTGRTSQTYGGAGGQPFSLSLGPDQPIGGLDIQMSINGWIRVIRGAVEVSKVRTSSVSNMQRMRDHGFIQTQQRVVRRRLHFLYLCLSLYACFLFYVLGPFVRDVALGPTIIDLEMFQQKVPSKSFVLIPENSETILRSTPFSEGQQRMRWVVERFNLGYDTGPVAILVKELVNNEKGPLGEVRTLEKGSWEARSGIVRRVNFEEDGVIVPSSNVEDMHIKWMWETGSHPQKPARMDDSKAEKGPKRSRTQSSNIHPLYYVDESFSPVFMHLCTFIGSASLTYLLVRWGFLCSGLDPVTSRFATAQVPGEATSREDLIVAVDHEIREPETLVLAWDARMVAVTRNWFIKTNYLSIDVVAINDARIADLRVSGRWILGELVEIVTMRVESRRSVRRVGHQRSRALYSFEVALPRGQFEVLRASFIESVRQREEIVVTRREAAFQRRYNEILCERAREGICFSPEEFDLNEECLGACGNAPSVLIRKRCSTCEERTECPCEPAWCHTCLLKWWFSRNRTRMELVPSDDEVDPSWQGQCPTCRVYFCLDDVIPRFDIAELLVAEGGSTHEDGHGAAQLYDESTNDDSDHVETERDDERNNNEPNLPFFTGGGTAPSQESGSQLSQRERGSSDSWPEEESSRSTASMQAQGLRRRILSRPTQASSTEPSSEGVNSGNTTTGPSVSSEETANSISERRARAAEAAERRRIG